MIDYNKIIEESVNEIKRDVNDVNGKHHPSKWLKKAIDEVDQLDKSFGTPEDQTTNHMTHELLGTIAVIRSMMPKDKLYYFDHAIVYALRFGGAIGIRMVISKHDS